MEKLNLLKISCQNKNELRHNWMINYERISHANEHFVEVNFMQHLHEYSTKVFSTKLESHLKKVNIQSYAYLDKLNCFPSYYRIISGCTFKLSIVTDIRDTVNVYMNIV